MAKIFQTLRNNWKKSIVFSGALVYGVNYGKDRWKENELMRKFAAEAARFGEKSIPLANTRSYHVTVILNPAANGGKGRKNYEQYCAPLLHLAGLKVSVIRTEAQSQASEIMELMDDTDAVLVAGGDGTLMETVTGLLRRKDVNIVSRTLPLGILPVGKNNHMAKRLCPDRILEMNGSVPVMAEAAMNVIKRVYRPVDVMEVKIKDEDATKKLRPLYGLREVRIGAFDDAHDRMGKYWYWFGLKKYMTYIWSYTTSASKITWNVSSKIQCGTQSVDSDSETAGSINVKKPQSRSFWSLWPSAATSSSLSAKSSNNEVIDNNDTSAQATPDNMQQIQWTDTFDYSGCELSLQSSNNFPLSKDEKSSSKMALSLGPNELSFMDYVREGWRREQVEDSMDSVPKDWLKTGDSDTFLWHPHESLTSQEDDQERFLFMDSESIDIQGPIQVSMLPDKIVMFCSPSITKEVKSTTSSVISKKWWLNSNNSDSNRKSVVSNMPKLNI